jgi:hypothetical protein
MLSGVSAEAADDYEPCPGSGQKIFLAVKRTTGREYGPCPACQLSVPLIVPPLQSSGWVFVADHERRAVSPLRDVESDPWRDLPCSR